MFLFWRFSRTVIIAYVNMFSRNVLFYIITLIASDLHCVILKKTNSFKRAIEKNKMKHVLNTSFRILLVLNSVVLTELNSAKRIWYLNPLFKSVLLMIVILFKTYQNYIVSKHRTIYRKMNNRTTMHEC